MANRRFLEEMNDTHEVPDLILPIEMAQVLGPQVKLKLRIFLLNQMSHDDATILN